MFEELQKNIKYTFADEKLLEQALTHSSYVNEHGLSHADCNERLEYLGDAVLELASSDFLYRRDSQMPEGKLTKLRAALVCESALAEIARDVNLGDFIILGVGEKQSGGNKRDSILSDALESVIGAIYLDSGFTNAKEFVDEFVMKDIDRRQLFFDSKTILQEEVQGAGLGDIHYELDAMTGPDHDKTFSSSVYISGEKYGAGSAHTKKGSEQAAAYQAILKIKSQN